MAKRVLNRLSDKECRNLHVGSKPLCDGNGLYLHIDEQGRKYWRLAYWIKGKERYAGGGRFPDVSLKSAREWRDDFRQRLKRGENPVDAAKQERAAQRERKEAPKLAAARTFKNFATAYHENISGEFRNAKHRTQWLASLNPVFEKLGDKDIGAIKQADLIEALRPLFVGDEGKNQRPTPETGKRVKQRVMAVFASAVFKELIATNPAAALNANEAKKELGQVIRRKGHAPHLAALPYPQVPGFVEKLRAFENASLSSRNALLFAILTASRTGEVLGMKWAELSADGAVWSVPAERMKGGETHAVFLSGAAQAILKEMREQELEGGYVFPSLFDQRKPLSGMAMLMNLRRMTTGEKRADAEPQTFSDITTVHGLCRSSFSTWANETGAARPDVIEACLAHREADRVRGAYNRAQFANERRELLDRWASFVMTSVPANVVQMKRKRSRAVA